MLKIGVISDTHAWWDDKYALHFADRDEIWHAGDIGREEVLDRLEAIKPVRAVYGNTDNHLIRMRCSETLRFKVEDMEVLMTHIGGYTGNYAPKIRTEIYASTPNIFVCGHSHILKVLFDKSLNMWCINPGAAGLSGYHQTRTLLRFAIDGSVIKDMEVIELA
jgi:putative phosphoesterase